MEPNHFYELKCQNLQFVVNSLEAVRQVLKVLRESEAVMPGKDVDFIANLDLEEERLENLRKYLQNELEAVYPLAAAFDK